MSDPIGDALRADVKYYFSFDALVNGMVLDKSGRGNNLINHGGIITTGLLSNALELNGVDQYLDADSTIDFEIGDNDFTLIALFNCDILPTTEGSGQQRLIEKEDINGDEYYLNIAYPGKVSLTIPDGGFNYPTAETAGSTVTAQNWHFIFARHDSTLNRLLIRLDNGDDGSIDVIPGQVANNSKIFIGSGFATGSWFDGKLNIIGKWNRLLSEDEMDYLYNSGAGRALFPAPEETPAAAVAPGGGGGRFPIRYSERSRYIEPRDPEMEKRLKLKRDDEEMMLTLM